MSNKKLSLFIEINDANYVFLVSENDNQENTKLVYEATIPLQEIKSFINSDLEKTHNIIKENIHIIEKKFNCTFKDIVLILDNFDLSFINLSGYKKLNGSQLLRENITYILNTLKAYVNEIESKKTILHIFNSKYKLDNKRIENLPIGLFGDFYAHELSLVLLNTNDYKNLHNIFKNCNLKIKKILVKSYVKGVYLAEKNIESENFFQIQISDISSKIFFFENGSLKFEQKFNFGTDIIIKDVSKIISLKKDVVEEVLNEIELDKKYLDNDILDKKYFSNENFRKIKKSLIYEIISARIKELTEIMVLKNINLKYVKSSTSLIYFELRNKIQIKNLSEVFKTHLLSGNYQINFIDNFLNERLIKTSNKLVHFGWKKEVIPIVQPRKSLIRRVFEAIFD